MRENAFCMVFHVRWISHHSSSNPTLVATRLGRDWETRGEKNPSHMENHTKCISSRTYHRMCRYNTHTCLLKTTLGVKLPVPSKGAGLTPLGTRV